MPREPLAKLPDVRPSEFSTSEEPTSYDDVTTYNNFYEFGTGKEDPYQNARDFVTSPWTVRVSGECGRPGDYHYEDIIAPHTLEDRVYRHRCVEAWSMVVPWLGIPLKDILAPLKPTSQAKYVEFKTKGMAADKAAKFTFEQMAPLGLIAPDLPEEFGGLGESKEGLSPHLRSRHRRSVDREGCRDGGHRVRAEPTGTDHGLFTQRRGNRR